MNAPTLLYVYDPLCGWCYAAAPLLDVAAQMPGVGIQLFGGGLFSDDRRASVTPGLRDYVMPHDHRIAQMTGQVFGDAYFEGLLRDTTAIFDSTPPIAAIVHAETTQGRGLALLKRIQQAHYVEGRRVADMAVLLEIASELGIDLSDLAAADPAVVNEHLTATRALMRNVRANGFPTLVWVTQDRQTVLPLMQHLGQPEAWQRYLTGLLAA